MLRASLLTVCLSSLLVLAGCEERPQQKDPVAQARAVCADLDTLEIRRGGFLDYLPISCAQATRDIAENASPRGAFRAKIYVDALDRLSGELAALPYPASDTGAYLIARDMGVTRALDSWLSLRRTNGLAELGSQSS